MWPTDVILLNLPSWPMQHIDAADHEATRCGIPLSGRPDGTFAPLPSRTLIGDKPVCATCLRTVWPVQP